jgi:hypothetical protein
VGVREEVTGVEGDEMAVVDEVLGESDEMVFASVIVIAAVPEWQARPATAPLSLARLVQARGSRNHTPGNLHVPYQNLLPPAQTPASRTETISTTRTIPKSRL